MIASFGLVVAVIILYEERRIFRKRINNSAAESVLPCFVISDTLSIESDLLLIALFLGSCLLCMASAFTGAGEAVTTVFRVLGFVGYALSIFFAFRLYRNMKKGK